MTRVATSFLIALFAALTFQVSAAATEETHWAFKPLQQPSLPTVQNSQWPQGALDHFILKRLEANGLTPAPPADRRTLIRRACFDLIGLPPSPREVEAFVTDKSSKAYKKLIDRLLNSKHYGERWGRHWLDVARYGDSNGGDENHFYPHAFRYRDYVIRAFNANLPYNQFITEQLAGDLLPDDPASSEDRLAATGFLAIGTKILAEQDGVKKQADIVDEQIDTIGKAFLGLTLGCARCHDHKFDPIPTADYYAIAGIFHSTALADRPLKTTSYRSRLATFEKTLDDFNTKHADSREELEGLFDTDNQLEWEAEKFSRGNVTVDKSNYGKEIGIISDPGGQDNYAEYDITVKSDGPHLIQVRYAAQAARPGRILIDGKTVREPAINEATGGWYPQHQRWMEEGFVELTEGNHTLRIESKPNMSHIDKVRLTPIRKTDGALAALDRLNTFNKEKAALEATKPEPPLVMAVDEGNVTNTKLNKRGNPHDLGETIPRGFLTQIASAGDSRVKGETSGRLELARWMTDPKHPLTSRVMVNRIWRWHFGRGLTDSMENFGLNGTAPSHPQLLDHLASLFIAGGWSIKTLHRHIMLSSTYQMGSNIQNKKAKSIDPGNKLYWKRDVTRMEAEIFRDSILHLAGTLDPNPPTKPLSVKSQDPSPTDIINNRKAYEDFPHRSVYLPVVRSHVYDMMTLLDFPNAATPVGNRVTTTVPTQALLMLNNPFLIQQAERLVQRTKEEPGAGTELERLKRLYLNILSRPATDSDIRSGIEFLQRYTQRRSTGEAWTALSQTLLISNDFIYLR